jgi:hypothetical protein
VAHCNGYEFGCNVGESDDVLQWPTEMGGDLGAILVNQMGYHSGLYLGAILVNQIGHLSGPVK